MADHRVRGEDGGGVSRHSSPRLLRAPFPRGSEDLTGAWMAEALGLDDPAGRAEVTRIGAGRGHMGSAFRVRFPDGAARPAMSFVVKLPAAEEAARDTADRGGLYEREVRFFTDVAPRSPLRVPRCYAAGHQDGEGFALVLEDLGAATEIDQLTGLDVDRARGVLGQMAEFHAAWWGADELDEMTWATRHTDEHRVANLTRILREGWPRLTSELAEQLPAGCHQAGADMADLLSEAFGALAAEPQTLLHGDVRLDNLLFEGPTEPAVILDWQSVSRGAAAIDVAYFLAQNIPGSDLAAHGDELLDGYRMELVRRGVEQSPEQLRRAVALAMPLTFAVAASLFVVADLTEPRTRDLAAAMATRAQAAVEHFGHPRDLLVGV